MSAKYFLLEQKKLDDNEINEAPIREEEKDLVDRARNGDPDAFGELVRRNRAKVYGLAYQMTNDHHLAEDVVQEALIRAFLHVGNLMDIHRFKPWLHKIVRNEAYMKLRRGGVGAKEKSFSRLADKKFPSTSMSIDHHQDWRDIDRILFQLSKIAMENAQRVADPSLILLRKEMMEDIRSLYHCLSKKEKQIFEAYFFEQIPPQEIAALLDTNVANIYNNISRARRKLQQERILVHINYYVKERQKNNKPSKKILQPPAIKILWKEGC